MVNRVIPVKTSSLLSMMFLLVIPLLPLSPLSASGPEMHAQGTPVLWQAPADIASRNLYYGPGGEDGQPAPPFEFEKEDLDGTNPKFSVIDSRGVRWKVKLGVEARPEVAAARLLWAVGYFAQVNYLVPKLEVRNLPGRLKRGQEHVVADGAIYGARLKRMTEESKKADIWRWKKNPFKNTRELNGLRVMMAFLNNLDLKDRNNGIYRVETLNGVNGPYDVYAVSDLGCSFSKRAWPGELKGNLKAFRETGFIRKAEGDSVDFELPMGPGNGDLLHLSWHATRTRLGWIGRDIPRSDAKWIGKVLGQLSRTQIEDAFRAAGFFPDEVKGFTDEIMQRIEALQRL